MDENGYPGNMKRCCVCKELKTLLDFYRNGDRLDGHQNACKECQDRKYKQRWYGNVEDSRRCQRERMRRMRQNVLLRIREKDYQKRHLTPDMIRAHHANRKFKIKPLNCTDCGKETSDLERHHEDYTKPLEVVWLCSPCHRQRTLRSIKNAKGNRKTSEVAT